MDIDHTYSAVLKCGSTEVTISSQDKSIVKRISSYRLPKKPIDTAHVFRFVARQASNDGFDTNSLSGLEKGVRINLKSDLWSDRVLATIDFEREL